MIAESQKVVRQRGGVDWRFIGWGAARGLGLLVAAFAALVMSTWSPWLALLALGPAVVAVLRGDRISAGAWVGYLVCFAGFILIRRQADNLGFPVRWAYPVDITRTALGGLPVLILQHNLRTHLLDQVAIAVYLSYFFVPPACGIILFRRRRLLVRYVAGTAVVFAIALVAHVLVPTVPPWMAAAQGHIPPVHRILWETLRPLAPTALEGGYQASQNDVAAMPSVHMALTLLAMLAFSARWPRLRLVAAAYVLMMLFSVVYLGEHYLIDALAGMILSVVAWWACGLVRPYSSGSSGSSKRGSAGRVGNYASLGATVRGSQRVDVAVPLLHEAASDERWPEAAERQELVSAEAEAITPQVPR